MTTANESPTSLFEETFDDLRNATESALQLQQEMYSKWTKLWPEPQQSKNEWAARIQKFQKGRTSTVTEMMKKHRKLLDEQYREGIKSVEEVFRVGASENVEEFREGCESLGRKALDRMKATSEKQIQQFQETVSKWTEICHMKA